MIRLLAELPLALIRSLHSRDSVPSLHFLCSVVVETGEEHESHVDVHPPSSPPPGKKTSERNPQMPVSHNYVAGERALYLSLQFLVWLPAADDSSSTKCEDIEENGSLSSLQPLSRPI